MTPIDDEAQAPFIQEVADGEEEQGPKTLAEQLKQRRSEIAETRDVLLPLTGYDEFGVVVKHRLMDRTEVERIGRRVITETKERGERNMRILLDVIINSTRGFYLQEDGKEPQEIIDDTNGNQSVLNWSMFAHYLGWVPQDGYNDSRTALYFVFGANEFAIGQYGILLNRWMTNTGLKVDEEFLGEVL